MRRGCRAGALRVSSVSLGPSSPPGSAHAPLNGSLARCHSRTCSLPSRTWSTTASASWLAGALLLDSPIGYRLIIVNCRIGGATHSPPHAHGSDAPHASAPALRHPTP